MKHERHGSRKEIENWVDNASPGIFQDGPGKPQKPHVANDVHPATMQEICSDVGNGLRMRGDEGVVGQNRIAFDFGILLLKRIHFALQFRGVFD